MMKPDIRKLPLELKVGQMMMAGFGGGVVPPHIEKRLDVGALGGVILFGGRALSASRLRGLTAGLQDAAVNGASGLPLLVSTDQEGGRVSRLSPPLTRFPGAWLVGGACSAELAEEMGGAVAAELMAVGVNMNLAPVLDVLSNPSNSVIGDRALGACADRVARLGRAVIRGFQSRGVMAVAKHFPGHGDSFFDSHHELGVIEASEEELMGRELVPFRAAVDEGVAAVMTAHVVYGGVDPDAPATLSHKIITGLLREGLGYNGIVITDDLEMNAVTGGYSIGDAAVAAVSAGADILLVCREGRAQEEAYVSVLNAVREGRIGADRIDESFDRITRAKEKFAAARYTIGLEVIGCSKHKALARRIEASGRKG